MGFLWFHMIIWLLIFIYIGISLKRMFGHRQREIYLRVKWPNWYLIGVCLFICVNICLVLYIGYVGLNQIFLWNRSGYMNTLYFEMIWSEACFYIAVKWLLTLLKQVSFGKEGMDCFNGLIPWEAICRFERDGKQKIDIYYKVDEEHKKIVQVYHDEKQGQIIEDLLIKHVPEILRKDEFTDSRDF